MPLTRTAGASATAKHRVRWLRPALATAYAMLLPSGAKPAIELMLMIRPPSSRLRAGANARDTKNGADMLWSMISLHTSGASASMSGNGTKRLMAALLTTTSTRPKASTTSSSRRATSAASARLAAYTSERTPSRRSPSATDCVSPIEVRQTSARSQPARAKPSANRRPSPPFAPVTTTTLPRRSIVQVPFPIGSHVVTA